jgi:polysaccharide pyruvyl transferase WcaK-like protein
MPDARSGGRLAAGPASTARSSRRYRVGLLGMFTSRNVGDAAIVHEVIRNIAARRPDCNFVAINRDPEDAVRTLGLPAFPSEGYGPALHADGRNWSELERPWPKWMERGLGTRRIIAAARQIDLLVMSGGGQIEDFFGGTGSQPRVLLTWTLLARLFGIPVAYFAVGVDQLLDPTSRMLSVQAVRLASMRSFRDAGSVALLREAGLRVHCRVDPDPALGIDVRSLSLPTRTDQNLIVVSPISYRTWTNARETSYDAYLACLASACRHWLSLGQRIRFVCSDISMDPPVVAEVLAQAGEGVRRQCEFVDVQTFEQFIQAVAPGRLVVASRLHGLILALVAGVPAIAVSPARKVTRFMRDCGFEAHCVEMGEVKPDTLVTMAARIQAESPQIRQMVAAVTARSRAQLAQAYDALVALAPRPAPATIAL